MRGAQRRQANKATGQRQSLALRRLFIMYFYNQFYVFREKPKEGVVPPLKIYLLQFLLIPEPENDGLEKKYDTHFGRSSNPISSYPPIPATLDIQKTLE